MVLPVLDPADVAVTHLLALPADVDPEELGILAVSRFARATWEQQPATAATRTQDRRRSRSAPGPGRLRLSRHSVLVGPYAVEPPVAASLGLPMAVRTAYLAHAPVERGDRPWPGGGDRDGLGRAFPDGLPVRDEERTVGWLVAVARRLGGAVRIASQTGRGAVLVPDPASAVDLTVWTDIWLEPDAALAVVRQALPRAYLNLPEQSWAGPPVATGTRPAPGAEALDPAVRRSLHVSADDYDIAALTAPEPMRGYGVLAELDLDGIVALEVGADTPVPPAVAAVPWAAQGAVAYRVRWEPVDLEDAEAERPPPQHRVARGRATPLVVAVARAVHAAVGGEITDAMDFIVDPADL